MKERIYRWFERQCKFFHEHHRTDRWNLQDPEDAFQLYYSLEILAFRNFELFQLLHRDKQYAKAHEAFSKYSILRTVINDIFPYCDGSGNGISNEYQRVQREIRELEEKFGTI